MNGATIDSASAPTVGEATAAKMDKGKEGVASFNEPDGPHFSDLLDILNPLQHIPVINTLYQHLTGDKEGAVAELAGGMLWGGPIGLAAAMVNLVVEDTTGKSIGDNVVALFSDDRADTAVAADDKATGSGSDSSSAALAKNVPESVTMTDLPAGSGQAELATDPTGAAAPIAVGSFLVFGAAQGETGSGRNATLSATRQPATDLMRMASVSAEVADGPVTAGDFLVFGGGSAATRTSTAPAPDNGPIPLTPMTSANSGTGSAAAVANNTAANNEPASPPTAMAALQANPAARAYLNPPRRTSVTPPANLPLPTTGPAAVPGNARAAAYNRSAVAEGDNSWFVSAFNQAMDKYNRAAGLGRDDGSQGEEPSSAAN
jgi:hypothetical protein